MQTRVEDRGLTAVVCHDELPGGALPNDIVVGPNGAALTLLRLTPRREVGTVWDLGSGCGVQAVFAAQHANRVVATDIDERALQLTADSAAASLVDVETRLGSLAAPVQGERFDLIVSNPPFVIGGATGLTHRESPLAADRLARELLSSLPNHLDTGGLALMLCAWLETESQSWDERITDWLPDGVDVWVALRELVDLDTYIGVWSADAGRGDDLALQNEWRQTMESFGATGVAFGWIALRQTSGPPAIRVEDVRAAALTPDGDQLLERLAAARAAEELTAVQVISGTFASAAGQSWRGEWALEPLLFALRERFDGGSSTTEIVAELSAAWVVDEDDLLIHALAGVRALVDLGLLVQMS